MRLIGRTWYAIAASRHLTEERAATLGHHRYHVDLATLIVVADTAAVHRGNLLARKGFLLLISFFIHNAKIRQLLDKDKQFGRNLLVIDRFRPVSYSVLIFFTGFSVAARQLWTMTVSREMMKQVAPAAANIQGLSAMR